MPVAPKDGHIARLLPFARNFHFLLKSHFRGDALYVFDRRPNRFRKRFSVDKRPVLEHERGKRIRERRKSDRCLIFRFAGQLHKIGIRRAAHFDLIALLGALQFEINHFAVAHLRRDGVTAAHPEILKTPGKTFRHRRENANFSAPALAERFGSHEEKRRLTFQYRRDQSLAVVAVGEIGGTRAAVTHNFVVVVAAHQLRRFRKIRTDLFGGKIGYDDRIVREKSIGFRKPILKILDRFPAEFAAVKTKFCDTRVECAPLVNGVRLVGLI